LHEITPKNGQLVDHKLTVEDRPPGGGQRPVAHRLTVQDRPPKGARRPAAHKIALEGHPHAHKMSLEAEHRSSQSLSQVKKIMRRLTSGRTSAHTFFVAIGGKETPGFQLRYIYFLDKPARDRLTVPEILYSKIQVMGAGMYKGQPITRAADGSNLAPR